MNTGGSVILIRKKCSNPGSAIIHKGLFPGRDHLFHIRCEDSLCIIVHVHFQPEGTLPERERELRGRLRHAAEWWSAYPEGLGFLMGDFNISDPDEGALNARNQTFSAGDASRAAAFLAAFSRSVEIGRPSFTRKDGRRDGSIHTLSWIDRTLTKIPMAELRDCRCYAHTIGCVGERRMTSEYVPVRLPIDSPQGRREHQPVIRQRLPLFRQRSRRSTQGHHWSNSNDKEILLGLVTGGPKL